MTQQMQDPRQTSAIMLTKRQLLALGAAAFSSYASTPAFAQDPLQDEVWTDSARGREVPVLVRWPAGKPEGVLVFSHGLGGKRTGADLWGSAWAQAGFLVLHLQHPGSDAAAVKGLGALNKAMAPEQLVARVADIKFSIDEVQRRRARALERWRDVPLERLALAGHSFGARTVQAMAGQAYPKAGGWSGVDQRIQAFIALSPALGKGTTPSQAREDAKAMVRPMLLVTGGLDGEILNNGETPASRRMAYDVLPAGAKSLLWLQSADHMTFAGVRKQIPSNFLVRRETSTLTLEAQHHALVADTTTRWLKAKLLGADLSAPSGLSGGDLWLQG